MRKRKPESEDSDAKEREQEEMQNDKTDKLEELQAKVEKPDAGVAKAKGGKTGFEPSGAATSGCLNSPRRMAKEGRNAKEIMIPKISVTGLGDYTHIDLLSGGEEGFDYQRTEGGYVNAGI